MPGVPGLFTQQQADGWRKVVDAVHEKGGYIYCQLWHAGRATIPQMTGSAPVSASASVWDSPDECYSHMPVGESKPVRYADHPPVELSVEHIKKTIEDYCDTAEKAMQIGFDGVEIHSGNGYLPEQFLSSNINKRTDYYGGSPEKRCHFVLELMNNVAKRIGEGNLAIRLSPFGLFNQARGEQRVETWTYLCKSLKLAHPALSYVSFVEPVSVDYEFSGIQSVINMRTRGTNKYSATKRKTSFSPAGVFPK
jgi:2,4-dienoyl-CoA reductase-like NADH-dependent reductase (Old Yellow Enzyme family)